MRFRCHRGRWNRVYALLIVLAGWGAAGIGTAALAQVSSNSDFGLKNGWFVFKGHLIWGYAQHNAWWTPKEGANLTRHYPGQIGPNRTEDLDKLTDNMLRYGYPGFEHNYGLWYDRRRDVHDTGRRTDSNALPPFLEQPWARSDTGTAWDGLPKYDLARYNPWYFDRLKEFATLCERKGTILFHNFYMQHALLEADTHYVDFPWRPDNCLQETGMPDHVPAANAFYDVTHPMRRELHRAYIRKCLDELGGSRNVVHLLSEEYTGDITFMRFWLDVVTEWEREKNTRLLLALGGPREVLDALADDDRITILDLRYWWYQPDGALNAPPAGKQVAGRYAMGKNSAQTTPQAIYRQIKEYRLRYPSKGLLHHIHASRQQIWAFLMGGGSMLVRFLPYAGGASPTEYIAPEASAIIQPTYDFIRRELSERLPEMVPLDLVQNDRDHNWCLGRAGKTYLVYALKGGAVTLDLSAAKGEFLAKWFDPRTGSLQPDAENGTVSGGKVITFNSPGPDDWVLWLTAIPVARSEAETNGRISQLVARVPGAFPHFTFANHPEAAQLLTHYLWYHFHHRLGNSPRLFDKDYLLTSDIWMGHISPRGSGEPIQEVHRRNLLKVFVEDEGYVSSHQHFSQAHDLGWPFPSWAQAANNPDEVKGKAVGWHFQPLDKVPGWVGAEFLRKWNLQEYCGETAASRWEVHNIKSLGIHNLRWQLEATGISPEITTPEGCSFDAFNAPYLQLRWKRTGSNTTLPFVEWLREGDTEYGPERRVYFSAQQTPLSRDCFHSIITMYRHPHWNGKIKRVRISLAPGEADTKFEIDSFFTVYDTRHTINNPIFILASCRYFKWTGDLDFLRLQINRLRFALRYQQTTMGGLRYNRIRNPWPGHDGLPGWHKDAKGRLTFHPGHGIGNNYWDILPFGWDDMYATQQYYASILAMAGLEDAIRQHPGWDIPLGALALDPKQLRKHAEQVKETANRFFWSESAGRFIACVDKAGTSHDYGYTFLNLESIWYDLASAEHARNIMDWITGKRMVTGDTSVGEDIYRWRFGPRASTRRNIEWYGQGWWAPESLAWGYQVQDGGAVLGFTFYDLWARLQIFGPDNAWQRLLKILAWENEVRAEGGYREYYKGEKRGTTLQGGGTCGGLGIDFEFYESSLLPAIVPYGFLGLDAKPDGSLFIDPQLPDSCPEMAISNLQYRNVRFAIRAANKTIQIDLQETPRQPLHIKFAGTWNRQGSDWRGSSCKLREAGQYIFARCD